MKSRNLATLFGVILVLVLVTGACAGGFVAGTAMGKGALPWQFLNTGTTGTQTTAKDPTATFQEVWQILHDYYVDQPVDNEKLIQGALKGMVDTLGDEHTAYMTPQELVDSTQSLSGEYEGIGALVNTEGEFLTITEPLPNSPAKAAGLLPGDQIIAVDGKDVTGEEPEAVRQKILGPKGSTVVITIRREGKDPFDVTIQRARVVVPSVEGKMLEDGIAYIKIRTFGQHTGDELKSAIEDLMKQNPTSLIVDLRNNGGGLLNTAVEVSSQFLKEGVVVYEQHGDGSKDTLNVKAGGLATDIRMVLLVNEFSASASEIVAGDLQDYQRATLIGHLTYGKGTVQQVIPLSDNQGAVRVTIARWLTPKERMINKVGITPDIAVEMTEDDMKAGRDPQLDKAIEFLKTK
jgi:carboxyl-terminal processing protease